ncbi:hypothetical protein QV09_02105 [Gallibacterium salpingitidis]|uniref:Uncharacterized protein n=1 Tax=Gallibacterium salpingitidis TaxID=505341 RepID=A0AB36E4B3_9PAST|nr:hypothetical protein [Gallibacterium salpingitidis]OBX11526.1 hypothetical protein QV09_02105 [Gallibacterium salpingitidis]
MKKFYRRLCNTFNATYEQAVNLMNELACECTYVKQHQAYIEHTDAVEEMLQATWQDVVILSNIDYPNTFDNGEYSRDYYQRLPLKYLKARWIFFKYQSQQEIDYLYKQCDKLVY